MSIELNPEERQAAVASIERWFREHMEEPIGNVAAMGLLGFFVDEVGPCLYNRGVADAQERLHQRVDEVDIELHAEPFGHWAKVDGGRGLRRGRT
ncbi:MAG: DUF2164 domain-containing protein [Rubrivivax sp.]